MYRQVMAQAQQRFNIYGVPVKSREFMGVLHLKGFIVDDAVIYSGASSIISTCSRKIDTVSIATMCWSRPSWLPACER